MEEFILFIMHSQVRLLLEKGAIVEEVNDEGYTPLMEASREGHLVCFNIFCCIIHSLYHS